MKAKRALPEIWNGPRLEGCAHSLRHLRWGIKYDRGSRMLDQGSRSVARFYDKYLRTNERHRKRSATIRHRTVRSKGCISNKTALAIYKLAEVGGKSWRGLFGHNQLPKVVLGVRLAHRIGIKTHAQAAAAWFNSSPTFDNNSLA
jgi:hypothetical protein